MTGEPRDEARHMWEMVSSRLYVLREDPTLCGTPKEPRQTLRGIDARYRCCSKNEGESIKCWASYLFDSINLRSWMFVEKATGPEINPTK